MPGWTAHSFPLHLKFQTGEARETHAHGCQDQGEPLPSTAPRHATQEAPSCTLWMQPHQLCLEAFQEPQKLCAASRVLAMLSKLEVLSQGPPETLEGILRAGEGLCVQMWPEGYTRKAFAEATQGQPKPRDCYWFLHQGNTRSQLNHPYHGPGTSLCPLILKTFFRPLQSHRLLGWHLKSWAKLL